MIILKWLNSKAVIVEKLSIIGIKLIFLFLRKKLRKLTILFFLQANNYATVTFDAQGNIIQEVVFTPFIFKTIKITKK